MKWTVSVLIVAAIFSKFLTKNYNNGLNLLKLLYRKLLPGYSENGIFDYVTITSAPSNDMLIYGEVF